LILKVDQKNLKNQLIKSEWRNIRTAGFSLTFFVNLTLRLGEYLKPSLS